MVRIMMIISISALCLSALGQISPTIEDINIDCVNPVYIITDDFNRDGYPDLAVACHSCDAIAAIPNRARNPVPEDQLQECNQFIDEKAVYWKLDDSPVALASGLFIGPATGSNISWQSFFPNIAFVTQFLPGAGRFSPVQPGNPFLDFRNSRLTLNENRLPFATLTHLVLDDFNNDGDVDLAVLDGITPQIGVYLSKRDTMGSVLGSTSPLRPLTKLNFPKTLSTQPTTRLAYGFVSASFMVSADFDRDGWKDLAIAVGGSIVIYRNMKGTFSAPTDNNVKQNAFIPPYTPSQQIFILPQLGVGITSMAVADFNRDGYIDIAAVDPQFGALIIVWNKGCWNFSYQRIKKDGGPYFVAILDCDRNGLPDIAVAERDADRVEIILTELVGTEKLEKEKERPDPCTRTIRSPELVDKVAFMPAFDISVGPRPVGLAIADYDRNGMQDIAVVLNGAPGPTVQVIYNPCCCPNCKKDVPCCEGEPTEPATKECGKEGDTKKGD
ncbi:FG-GAP repeat domain-containing protein [Candidatus Bipolaricaulota sp. J31]